LQENKKPEPAATAKDAEAVKSSTAEQNTISLALRQVGEEAAQKAKEAKKKVIETFTGVGLAEPEKEKAVKATPPVEPLSPQRTIVAPTVIQSPTSTAWRRAPGAYTPSAVAEDKTAKGSLQSPTSTAWKPTDINPPVIDHRGSSISEASKETIKKIEDDCAIPEEDEKDSGEAVKD
jgi:hypothetical protein